ncbi:1-(5-phosphoribosyl)-5-[(5-phosphoribosylamino)methylideneamino]imidazole-4-carboxamide isomerase [Fructobacillus ficulneus]|uniref:1-(5-phosphoribosyl)-5-[(5-phosphoribosylamino)methylideneamino] imidazole-4-carboxamide isomerase n=1 Tax=Fructobacillus ficulneus TaxID=157463 RepID=A0A0K8MGF3_9LACO|nr:1-(5-phosphoribosyl)-5-[(5-phosphoribosylamino)methylideneamino]imidazole-4-carboxamide isomerase [Fructobacillus ficulneus]GAO99636.1 1-(5-phosphoribosyl)-5-[(5-phosphoribosylamino) methylideneamino]imidazole-4-carboxamide isomerase [Fructobacillus ficulneus]
MIIPAIDLIDGQSVRLFQGDYQKKTLINASPLDQAKEIEAAGLQALHLVDLDGAKAGRPVNKDLIEAICRETNLRVELGGGIRTMDQVDAYLQMGVNRVIIGSAALKNPGLVSQAVAQYGSDKVVVGIDGKNGKVATEGWLVESDLDFAAMIEQMAALGVQTFIVTDVATDGTLAGPNVTLLAALQKQFPASQIIASGGVGTMADIVALQDQGIQDVIVGRALYDGGLELADLQEVDQ